jgi:dTDP-glucose 4,6-dehydratase
LRVLITGGAGFIGSHLCDRFLADGHQVLAVDNLVTGDLRNIAHLRQNPHFAYQQLNVSDGLDVAGSFDLVLHFASPASPIDYLKHPIETLRVGAHGTLNALEVARRDGARFLLASTSEIYGDPLEHPQKESYLGNADTIGPRGCYDEAKRYAEAMTMAYHRAHGVDTRIVRIFNTYGPRMRLDDGRVVPNFIGQALRNEALTVYGDGAQTRCFQYVDDLIEGIVRLTQADYHEPVNIGTQQEMSILQFAEAVNQLTDNPAGIVFKHSDRIQGDPQNRKPDTSRAQALLGWQPRVPLAAGLSRTIAYFRTVVDGA